MRDVREDQALPIGTLIVVPGGIFRITAEPIGYGGGSIIYAAEKVSKVDNSLSTNGMGYIIKECFPASDEFDFSRDTNGEVVCVSWNSQEGADYLAAAKKRQLNEGVISREIYQKSTRVLPSREDYHQITLQLPGAEAYTVDNTITVMDSMVLKGQTIRSFRKQNLIFHSAIAMRIVQQLLFSLREVHSSGYLHLDIQDGNIFLCGDLNNNSEMITLIDFGSARKMVGGKTEPIRDNDLYSTRGFTPPEMKKCKGGALQLTPAADCFSVGCLLYLLLVGKVPKTEELIRLAEHTIEAKIGSNRIPRHLKKGISGIIHKATRPSPEDRYQSAEAMLNDVTEIVNALAPSKTALATCKYDAFICYKHGIIDSKAAVTLRDSLETFRCAGGEGILRKPFGRVFVDEGELSSCADFGQQIREALKNSAWLIVICSPDTPSSHWVQQEIDVFLEYHDRSRILAVMTSGSPEISFPPQLKGTAQSWETLAADARGENWNTVEKKLHGDALLRIAAPMLSLPFDSLKQRQKLYKMRRTFALACFALALLAGFSLFAWNRAEIINKQKVQIQIEYENQLIKESRYLTAVSDEALTSDDPLLAITAALQALPSGTNPRPYIPEAEASLIRAINPYDNDSLLSAQNVYTCENLIRKFCLSNNGSYLYILDTKGIFSCWQTDSYKKCFELQFSDDDRVKLIAVGDSDVLVCSETIQRIDSNGSMLWSTPGSYHASLSPDGKQIVISQTVTQDTAPYVCEKITIVQTDNEQESETFEIASFEERRYCSAICWSADGRKVIVDMENSERHTLYLIDTISSSIKEIQKISGYLYGVQGLSSGNILIVSTDDISEGTGSVRIGTGWSYYNEYTIEVRCVSMLGETVWSERFQASAYTTLLQILESIDRDSNESYISITGGDFCSVFSLDGERIYSCRLPDELLFSELFSGKGQTLIRMISASGAIYLYDTDSEIVSKTRTLPTGIEQAYRKDEDIYMAIGNRMLHYSVYDSKILTREEKLAFDTVYDSLFTNEYAAFFGKTKDGATALHVLFNDRPDIYQVLPEIPQFSEYVSNTLTFASDGSNGLYLYVASYKPELLIFFDLLTEESGFIVLDSNFEDGYYLRDLIDVRGAEFVFAAKDYSDDSACILYYNYDGSSMTLHDSIRIPDFGIRSVWHAPDGDNDLIAGEEHWYLYQRSTNMVTPLGIESSEWQFAAWHPQKNIFSIAGQKELYTYEANGNMLYTVTISDTQTAWIGYCPSGEYCMAVNTLGELRIIDPATGQVQSTTDLTCYAIRKDSSFESIIMPDGCITIRIDDVLNIIDCDAFLQKAYVNSCFGYMQGQNVFCCYSRDEDGLSIGYIPYYTLEELIELAKEKLADYEVPLSDKLKLGLSA